MKIEHQRFIAMAKLSGAKILTFSCPVCLEDIETPAPPVGEVWDSFVTCPHCSGLFFKVATNVVVNTFLSEDMEHGQN
ncbi:MULTISPECIES: hypothetical protein [Klebsiella]|uniref:hypothetical protein n=1 Tax=Klebsiella TaxID=570 RepID=UPI001158DFC6|nr:MULTISPECIES: hypothetical protein [Klebsiella]MBX7525171.1 hypothetical protein [Klebsiella pneumoniae]MDE1588031.1 hypothetical protein [Klebsiella quasipneumoniae]MDE1598550.1 hypothetical protein [Klebsiella quasipneumoniae]MDE1603934.1 hypothetical protein [Klebsiella quasipneumoniae]MDE1609294.1 hypothetical protein [Klebsiella quasipneumoniae]